MRQCQGLSSWIVAAFVLCSFLLGGANTVQAAEKFCTDAPYFGVIDGNVVANAPTQITIDDTCTFKNWPISRPLSTNINFQTNDPSIYLIIFDNVYYTGNMACANIPHKLWVVNSREDAFSVKCQDIIVPPESIDKQSPVSSIGIGEQFTYRLVLPSMLFPEGVPSPNNIGDVVMTDDLDATGASLTLIGTPTVTFADSGLPVPHTFSQSTPDGGLLTFAFDNTILAGQQINVDITVEVDDDSSINTAGTQILNIAEWEFSRSIDLDENGIIEDGTVDLDGDGIIEDEFFNPLPGESGVADPITISEPSLVVSKTSDQTAVNLGVPVTYTIDVQNVGGADAWNVTVTDFLPDLPAAPAGMCDIDPSATVTAEVFEADGVTSVSGPLTLNTDFSVNYSASPTCEFSISTLSAQSVIGPNERLMISFVSGLDADTTADTQPLTNIAGAELWYSGPNTVTTRREFPRTVTDGTPGIVDFQDNYTITTALSGYYFEQTATNTVTGALPAQTANAGDRIRYRLRLFNVDQTINNIEINQTLNPAEFDLSSFSMVDDAGASYSFDSVSGQLIINGGSGSLNVAQGNDLNIVFEVNLSSALTNGDVIEIQASLAADQNTADTSDDFSALSDDPYINGVSDPDVDGDEDPTPVTIQTPGPLAKATTQSNATIGETFTYLVTVPATPINTPLYDVRILDDLSSISADLRFVQASVQSGGSWALSNTGTATNVVIEDTSTGIDIAAGAQAVIAITVALENTSANQSGVTFTNSAQYTYNRTNNLAATQLNGGGSSSGVMTVIEPDLQIGKSVSFVSPAGKASTDNAAVGDVLEYQVTLTNTGNSPAYDVSITDTLPSTVSLVASSASVEINGTGVAGFINTPDTSTSGELIWGHLNEDDSLDIPVNQTLVLTYQVNVDAPSPSGIANSVVAEWSSLNGASALERDGRGCPAISEPNDYCAGPASVTVSSNDNTSITKLVVSDSYNETPASSGDPVVRVGDTVNYQLSLNLQEYTTANVVVLDQLPDGMEYQSLVAITPASGSDNFTYTVNAQPASGDNGTLTWDLGDIVNTPSGDGTDIDTLVIEYQAVVVTDNAPAGINTATTNSLTNTASLSYTGGDPSVYPGRLTATDTVEVLQPLMSQITKQDMAGGRVGSGTSIDPYQVDIVNDRMNFEISSCNNGLAPAYGVIIQDQLAAELDEADLQVNAPIVSVGGSVLSSGVDYSLSLPARGGSMQITLQDSVAVDPGECVNVTYGIGFHSDTAPFSTWTNSASLTEYRSRPASVDGRIYNPADVAQVYMTNQIGIARLSKRLISGSEATIGEEVSFELVVPAVPVNAALDNVVVTDTLADAFEYLDATAVDSNNGSVSIADNSVAPNQVSLAIGTIAAGEQVTITLNVRLLNTADANAGDAITNTASYSYTGLDPAADTRGSSEPLAVIEPSIAIDKSFVNVTTPGALPAPGDVLRYTLEFTAAGGVADDEFSDAFDLSIEDSLSPGLLYQTGTAVVDGTGNTIADPVDNSGDGSNSPQTLTWDLASSTADIDVGEGSTVTVSYDVVVLNDVQPGQTLSNSAVVRWTGLDGASSLERTGSNSPAVNDYVAGPVISSVFSRLDVSVVKSVMNVNSGQDPATDAEPGDVLRYTLEISNNSLVAVTNAELIDTLAVEFAAGSLNLINYPSTADVSATDGNGGANNTGLLHVSGFTLAAAGDPSGDDTFIVEFTAQLAPVLDSGTRVLNTAEISGDSLPSTPSNTTSTVISSAPLMRVEKVSDDVTGDAASLQPGDTLRYTITVTNEGNENAKDVILKDLIPTFTRYVPGSTTLNGAPVSDVAAGVSRLQDGLLVHAPQDATAGVLQAGEGHIATIGFDVTVNAGVVGGTAISNQGFVSGKGAGTSGDFAETPSDDPATATVNDPTVDIVGDVALLDAHKTVSLQQDNGSIGIVDPGDTLRYTIVVSNLGTVDASGTRLVDAVPANTSYVANSVYLNGQAVGQPDGGVSPLVNGITIQSSDGVSDGVISSGSSATVVFDVLVDSTAAVGTVISNQGIVSSDAQEDEPTDADGIDSNGDQPTISVVGNSQLITITEEVFDLNGGVILPGDELEYVVTVTNIGQVPGRDVVIDSNLDLPVAGQLDYITGSARLNGGSTNVTFVDPVISGDYGTGFGDLAAGDSVILRYRTLIDSNQTTGTTITQDARVQWNAGSQSETASVSVVVGATPGGTATIGGSVWHDVNHNKVVDGAETLLGNWDVVLYRNSIALASIQTDTNGVYRFVGLQPNDVSGADYSVRFLAQGATLNSAALGLAHSPFTNGLHYISGILVSENSFLDSLNLPILPNGVVYDSVSREPVSGASLTMVSADTLQALPDSCFDDPNQQGQIVSTDGYYRFDINFSSPSCTTAGSYLIQVTSPSTGYEAGVSKIIPPLSDEATAAFDVPNCLNNADDAVPATADICEAVDGYDAPSQSVAARSAGTNYYLHLGFSNVLMPGESQLFNNHIPLDPVLDSAVAIRKIAGKVNVSRGDLVPYTITIKNEYITQLQDLTLVDTFPPGFKYVEGSARFNGNSLEPDLIGGQLQWKDLDLSLNEESKLELLFIPGAGVAEGEYINRAHVMNSLTNNPVSNTASATVRLVPDPTLDCSDIYGRVYEDKNLNGYPDKGEKGIAGARVVTARGLLITSDQHGRFHLTCSAVPNELRGSNFVLKLDERSLPSGYRITTENPRVVRLTRGKAAQFNFGSALHRVVRLDVADAVFEPGSTEMRPQWKPRLPLLIEELEKAPSILRVSYLADVESEDLVKARVAAIKESIAEEWDGLACCYVLNVETEIYWRRGSPPDRSGVLK